MSEVLIGVNVIEIAFLKGLSIQSATVNSFITDFDSSQFNFGTFT